MFEERVGEGQRAVEGQDVGAPTAEEIDVALDICRRGMAATRAERGSAEGQQADEADDEEIQARTNLDVEIAIDRLQDKLTSARGQVRRLEADIKVLRSQLC